MSQRTSFPTGMDQLMLGWTTGLFRWALATSFYVPNQNVDVYMSSVAPFELLDGSYARVTASGKTRNPVIVSTPGYVVFDCDDPSFGIISGGELAQWLILFNQVTNDADSTIVAALPVYYLANGSDVATFIVNPVFGAVAVSTACPGEF